MEDAPQILKIPKSECPDIWIRQPRHKWPKSWSKMEHPVVPLERIFFGHPWAGFYGKDNLRKSFWSTTERRFPIGNAYSYTMKIFLSVSVDEMKWAGKKQNITPMWKVLNKEVDLGEPTSFFDHVHLACTQRQCEIKDIVDNHRTMFESRISARATVKLPCSENLRISSWSVTWKGMSRNVWNDIVSWRTRRLNNSTKYQLHASMTTTSKKSEIRGRIVQRMLSIFSEMQILGMYWKTGYSVVSERTCTIHHKMDKVCGKRLSRLMSYIHHTCDYNQ